MRRKGSRFMVLSTSDRKKGDMETTSLIVKIVPGPKVDFLLSVLKFCFPPT